MSGIPVVATGIPEGVILYFGYNRDGGVAPYYGGAFVLNKFSLYSLYFMFVFVEICSSFGD